MSVKKVSDGKICCPFSPYGHFLINPANASSAAGFHIHVTRSQTVANGLRWPDRKTLSHFAIVFSTCVLALPNLISLHHEKGHENQRWRLSRESFCVMPNLLLLLELLG